ncbi:hypothetical protein AOLI_G00139140 [Acnodon oligacanthus]
MRERTTSWTALFGSTYLYEPAFSHMKTIKSKYRSTMTDDHLEVCLRLAISDYCLDHASLTDSIQCKSSEEEIQLKLSSLNWGQSRASPA